MNLNELLTGKQRVLGEESLYELSRRSPAVKFDAQIARGVLIYPAQFLDQVESA